MKYGKSSYKYYRHRAPKDGVLAKIIRILLIFIIIYELITNLFFTSIKMDSDAMIPDIEKGEFLFVFKPIYSQYIFDGKITIPGLSEPKRGDIVIYKENSSSDYPWYLKPINSIINFFTMQKISLDTKSGYSNKYAVKRIAAIPGDTVKVQNNIVMIKPVGSSSFSTEFKLTENKYIVNSTDIIQGWNSEENPFSTEMKEVVITQGNYFIISDNRELYIDSRNSNLVPEESIKGKVILAYWPLKNINVFY